MFKTTLKFERETKGTYVYSAGDDPTAPAKTLYITKSAVKGAAPGEITLE
jgi:hypothetical protein